MSVSAISLFACSIHLSGGTSKAKHNCKTEGETGNSALLKQGRKGKVYSSRRKQEGLTRYSESNSL